jgi:hypothetical protein
MSGAATAFMVALVAHGHASGHGARRSGTLLALIATATVHIRAHAFLAARNRRQRRGTCTLYLYRLVYLSYKSYFFNKQIIFFSRNKLVKSIAL